MRLAPWIVLLAGCGAASQAPAVSVAASTPTSVEAPVLPPAVRYAPPVDLGGSVATIEIVGVPDGEHVHACFFTLISGRFAAWRCGATPSSNSFALPAHAGDDLGPLLDAVDDWGTPVPDDAAPVPIAITLYGAHSIAHRHVDPDAEPPAFAALRVAAMAAAQEGLVIVRERAEACTTCAEGQYCEEQWACSTMGPDGKNCERVAACDRRMPATSACMHHYQCTSRRCEGTTELIGRCGA